MSPTNKQKENKSEPRGFQGSSSSSSSSSKSGKSSQENLSDFAKIGGDIFKKTVSSGLGVLKEVADGLPRDASQLFTKGKEEFFKNILSKDVMQFAVNSALEGVFSKIREHKLEISIQIKKADKQP